jgi:hypothetical protein
MSPNRTALMNTSEKFSSARVACLFFHILCAMMMPVPDIYINRCPSFRRVWCA